MLYLADQTGYWAFGDWWSLVGRIIVIALVALILALMSYAVRTLLSPLQMVLLSPLQMVVRAWNFLGICKVLDAVEELLPPSPQAIAQSVVWYGPSTRRQPDTQYLQTVVKGRGARRRLNGLMIRVDGQVARITLDTSENHRIDRHGLVINCLEVLSSSGRTLRSKLLNSEKRALHLCRRADCSHPPEAWHLPGYAVVDAGAIVDVNEYARMTSCRFLWEINQFVMSSGSP